MLNPVLYSGLTTAPSAAAPNRNRPANAVDDWGHEIFNKIDQYLQESRSANVPSSNSKYNHHTSTLSDASSTYSTAQVGRRGSGRQISIDPKLQSQTRQSVGPNIVFDSTDVAAERGARRRESDASSEEPDSGNQSNVGSHRNTKEFGDFYDSYWTRSGQPQSHGQQGNQNVKPGDMARDGRRPGQLELKPETIAEVPSPIPSPAIGKAV